MTIGFDCVVVAVAVVADVVAVVETAASGVLDVVVATVACVVSEITESVIVASAAVDVVVVAVVVVAVGDFEIVAVVSELEESLRQNFCSPLKKYKSFNSDYLTLG